MGSVTRPAQAATSMSVRSSALPGGLTFGAEGSSSVVAELHVVHVSPTACRAYVPAQAFLHCLNGVVRQQWDGWKIVQGCSCWVSPHTSKQRRCSDTAAQIQQRAHGFTQALSQQPCLRPSNGHAVLLGGCCSAWNHTHGNDTRLEQVLRYSRPEVKNHSKTGAQITACQLHVTCVFSRLPIALAPTSAERTQDAHNHPLMLRFNERTIFIKQAQDPPAHAEAAAPPEASACTFGQAWLGLAQLGEAGAGRHEVHHNEGGIVLDACVCALDGSQHLVRCPLCAPSAASVQAPPPSARRAAVSMHGSYSVWPQGRDRLAAWPLLSLCCQVYQPAWGRGRGAVSRYACLSRSACQQMLRVQNLR